MKKLLTLVATIALTFTLSGCDYLDFTFDTGEDPNVEYEEIDVNEVLEDVYETMINLEEYQLDLSIHDGDKRTNYSYTKKMSTFGVNAIEFEYTPSDDTYINGTIKNAFYMMEDTKVEAYEIIARDYHVSDNPYTHKTMLYGELIDTPISYINNNSYFAFLKDAEVIEIEELDENYAALTLKTSSITKEMIPGYAIDESKYEEDFDVIITIEIDVRYSKLYSFTYEENNALKDGIQSNKTFYFYPHTHKQIQLSDMSKVEYLSLRTEAEIKNLKTILSDAHEYVNNLRQIPIHEQLVKSEGNINDFYRTHYSYFTDPNIIAYSYGSSIGEKPYFYTVENDTPYRYIVEEDYFVKKDIIELPYIADQETFFITLDFDRFSTKPLSDSHYFNFEIPYNTFVELNPDFMTHIDIILNEKNIRDSYDLTDVSIPVTYLLDHANMIKIITLDLEEYVETKYDVNYASVIYEILIGHTTIQIDDDYLDKTVYDSEPDYLSEDTTYNSFNTTVNSRSEDLYDIDYFTFTVTETSTYEFRVTSDSLYNISVYDDTFERIHYYNPYDFIELELEPGTYYIGVFAKAAVDEYTLDATKK